jgi:F-type H+-transporting ATPase subunit b
MDLMQFSFPEWFFVALNLLILVLVLKRVLWKPVGKILEERQALAAKARQDTELAEGLRAEMEQLHAKAEADVGAFAARLMTEARGRAGAEYDRIIAEAERQAEIIIAAAKTKAVQERDKVLAEAKKQVAAAALEATGMLLRENMDTEGNRRLVELYLSERYVPA